jgi:hypothetical protein
MSLNAVPIVHYLLKVIHSASQTLGQPCLESERRFFQALAEEMRLRRRQLKQAKLALETIAYRLGSRWQLNNTDVVTRPIRAPISSNSGALLMIVSKASFACLSCRRRSLISREYDLHQSHYQRNQNRLEAYLSRHWPEVNELLALHSVTLENFKKIPAYG